ncbi:unnamed protein product [Trichobilharzia regenti]|nr:unnamed protein product [Trichobilharzia regenti]
MTDDESFPYDSSVYPELSSQGAYHPHEYVYERGEIDSLIEFARLRGIRVIVEFDTPGKKESFEYRVYLKPLIISSPFFLGYQHSVLSDKLSK